MFDLDGDHLHTNYIVLFERLIDLGFYVEILTKDFTCFNAELYNTLIIMDPEGRIFSTRNFKIIKWCKTLFGHDMSKPNERWCRILLEKKQHFPPPPCDPPPFLGKKFFFGFSEKFSKSFFNEIDCKKFSNFFYNEFSSKKFFNSLKMTTKNFRNFFQ